MKTVTIRSDYHVQNDLKDLKRLLDGCQRVNVSKFRCRLFKCRFVGPCDASFTVLRSDVDNLIDSIETSKEELHGLRVRILRGQTYSPDAYRNLLNWKKVAVRTLSLIA